MDMENFIIVLDQYWIWVLVLWGATIVSSLLNCFGDAKVSYFRNIVSIVGVMLLALIVVPLAVLLFRAHWIIGTVGAVIAVVLYVFTWKLYEKFL